MKNSAVKKKVKLPDTWLIVFGILLIMAILSWIVPSGTYDYEKIDVNGTTRNVVIAGTYHQIDKSETTRTGLLGLFAAL